MKNTSTVNTSQKPVKQILNNASQIRPNGSFSRPGLTNNSSFRQVDNVETQQPQKVNLAEEINRILQTTNPNAPQNLIRYNYNQKAFKTDQTAGTTHFHIALDGAYVLKDESSYNAFDQQETILFNQFNFSTRGTQTFQSQNRHELMQTLHFDQVTSKGQYSRSLVYDLYRRDRKQKQAEEQQQGEQPKQNTLLFAENECVMKQGKQEQKQDDSKLQGLANLSAQELLRLEKSLGLSEKLIAESTFSEVVTDFASWNDPADEFKQGEGNLYPLWKFSGPNVVSQIAWHPQYKSIFAVAYGVNQSVSTASKMGIINIFSLKNPFYPEKIIQTPCDALCISFYEGDGNLLLVGLLNGNVQVYDLAYNSPKLLISSSTKTGKHLTAVTSVKWRRDNDKDLNLLQFLSVSSDGQLISWAFQQGELKIQFKVQMLDNGNTNDVGIVQKKAKVEDSSIKNQNQKSNLQTDATILIAPKITVEYKDDGSTPVVGLTSLKMNPDQSWLFAIGSETGLLRVCSTDYLSNFIQSFDARNNGHALPINELSWNKFQSDILASCGEDYLLKVWKIQKQTPVFTYDLQAPVVACQWSRDVSSVLLAATSANTVHIFDFDQKKETEVCIQQVVPDDARLTKMCLNDYYPVVAIGDNKGDVRIFKLSPNLRKRSIYVPVKSKTGLIVQLSQQEIMEKELEMENKKLKDYLEWCEKCNAATGIE